MAPKKNEVSIEIKMGLKIEIPALKNQTMDTHIAICCYSLWGQSRGHDLPRSWRPRGGLWVASRVISGSQLGVKRRILDGHFLQICRDHRMSLGWPLGHCSPRGEKVEKREAGTSVPDRAWVRQSMRAWVLGSLIVHGYVGPWNFLRAWTAPSILQLK